MATPPAGQYDAILLIEKGKDRCSVKYKLLALILGKMRRGNGSLTAFGTELVDRKPLKA
jgi:hypothetical protein